MYRLDPITIVYETTIGPHIPMQWPKPPRRPMVNIMMDTESVVNMEEEFSPGLSVDENRRLPELFPAGAPGDYPCSSVTGS